MRKISIITPTSDREEHLRLQYETVKKQEGPWEWLIYDSSFRPSPFFSKIKDKRVIYLYDEKNLKVGKKRNLLAKMAQGDYICHFDDDDYYHPNYLARLREELDKVDFFKLSHFFCYSTICKNFFYWDCVNLGRTRYLFHPHSNYQIQEIHNFRLDSDIVKNGKIGFGFSYAYRKEVVNAISFKNVTFYEDNLFINTALKKGFRIKLHEDEEGLAVATIHDQKTSSLSPQFRLPNFIASFYCSDAMMYFKKYPRSLYEI